MNEYDKDWDDGDTEYVVCDFCSTVFHCDDEDIHLIRATGERICSSCDHKLDCNEHGDEDAEVLYE